MGEKGSVVICVLLQSCQCALALWAQLSAATLAVQMLFENTARVPLLIHTPSQTQMVRTTELVELVDLYPTVAALAGLPAPSDVDGTDLSALWKTPPAAADGSAGSPTPIKAAAFSQYPRCPSATNPPPVHKTCFELNDNMFGYMGYSIRVKEWRCESIETLLIAG